jgi:hypothetical protein
MEEWEALSSKALIKDGPIGAGSRDLQFRSRCLAPCLVGFDCCRLFLILGSWALEYSYPRISVGMSFILHTHADEFN